MLNNPWMLGVNAQGPSTIGNPALDALGGTGAGHMVVQTQSVSISSTDGSVIHQTNTYESWVTVSGPQHVGLDMLPSAATAAPNYFGSVDMGTGPTLNAAAPESFYAMSNAVIPITSEALPTQCPTLTMGVQAPFTAHNSAGTHLLDPVVALPTPMTVPESPLVAAVQNPSETYFAVPVSGSCEPFVTMPAVQNLYNPLVGASASDPHMPLMLPMQPAPAAPAAPQTNVPSWYLVVQDLPESSSCVNGSGVITPQASNSDDQFYHCPKCQSTFEKMSCLEWHLNNCQGIVPNCLDSSQVSLRDMPNTTTPDLQVVQCFLCKNLYNTNELLNSGAPFACMGCRSFAVCNNFSNNGKVLNCPECSEHFSCETDLEEHLSSHKSTVTICELPDNYVEENGSEDGDGNVSVMIEPPEDQEGTVSFESDSSGEDGDDIADDEIDYDQSCGECGKTFSSRDLLDNHSLSHDKVSSYGCTKCGVICVGKYNLDRHMQAHSKELEKEEMVDSCFEENEDDTKDGTQPFGCAECGRQFSDSNKLKEHCVTHLRAKPFSCTHCGERFVNTSSLEQHWKAHACETD